MRTVAGAAGKMYTCALSVLVPVLLSVFHEAPTLLEITSRLPCQPWAAGFHGEVTLPESADAEW